MSVFFFNDTATTEIYTLSLHDALPICPGRCYKKGPGHRRLGPLSMPSQSMRDGSPSNGASFEGPLSRRSEEHTSELQSRQYLVCRLLLEKKKNTHTHYISTQKHTTRNK